MRAEKGWPKQHTHTLARSLTLAHSASSGTSSSLAQLQGLVASQQEGSDRALRELEASLSASAQQQQEQLAAQINAMLQVGGWVGGTLSSRLSLCCVPHAATPCLSIQPRRR